MKLRVEVDSRTFVVEVGSLSDRPVVAVVEGERFEVWPEGEDLSELEPVASGRGAGPAPVPRIAPVQRVPGLVPGDGSQPMAVYAPIPGVIEAISAGSGDQVVAGQELCVLEAMKMKNTLRAPRDGEIGNVHVTVGQHVKHHDILVEYAD